MRTLFEVVAEDEYFLVINKPAGLVCHHGTRSCFTDPVPFPVADSPVETQPTEAR